MKRFGCGVAVIGALLGAGARPAAPCATVMRGGDGVKIQDEYAVIVWDAERKMEHFIRRATFAASEGTKDFGFLVPTPQRPELAEAPADIFKRIYDAIEKEREVVRSPRVKPDPLLFAPGCNLKKGIEVPGVRLLEEKVVAGLDATVLQADDAAALAAWLGERGFENRPALVEWLAPYVAARWTITAFRYHAGAPRVPGAALRMSFAAEEPFFPYSEPADATTSRLRSLSVYVIAGTKIEAFVGDERPWRANVEIAGRLPGLVDLVRDAVPVGAVAEDAWITAFQDHARQRDPADVVFLAASDDTPVTPMPRYVEGTWVPVDVVAGVGVILVVVALRVRRRLGRHRD